MSAQHSSLLTIFNNHFGEFISDIYSVFPDNVNILTAKNAMIAIRKANPKLTLYIWTKYISKPYRSQIDKGDISFFVEKDYSKEFENHGYGNDIMEYINMLRGPVNQMSVENKAKTMKYIQNLCKIADLL